MFPLRDENPTSTPAFVTYFLVAINLAAWVFAQGAGSGDAVAASVSSYGLIPSQLMLKAAPEHLLTSMFLHGSWGHILGNMWFLFIFGDNVEEAFGHTKFLLFYLVSGFVAAALQVAMEPGSMIPMVGASGAISGVLGAYVVLYPRARVHNLLFLGFYLTTIRLPAWVMLGYWVALQVLGGIMAQAGQGGTAFWAHIGGFGAGVILGFLFGSRVKRAQRWQLPLES